MKLTLYLEADKDKRQPPTSLPVHNLLLVAHRCNRFEPHNCDLSPKVTASTINNHSEVVKSQKPLCENHFLSVCVGNMVCVSRKELSMNISLFFSVFSLVHQWQAKAPALIFCLCSFGVFFSFRAFINKCEPGCMGVADCSPGTTEAPLSPLLLPASLAGLPLCNNESACV